MTIEARTVEAEARATVRALYPMLSKVTRRCRSAIIARSGGEIVPGPSKVVLELPADASAGVDWAETAASAPQGARLVIAGAGLDSPYLEKVLFEAGRRSLDVTVEAAGGRLEEFAPMLYALNVATVRVTVYGPEPVHNRAALSAHAFESIARGAIALKLLSAESRRPAVHVEIPVEASNQFHLCDAVECALSMGADRVTVRHPAPGALRGSRMIMPRHRGGNFDEPHREMLNVDEIIARVKEIDRRWQRGNVRVAPNLTEADLRRYYTEEPAALGPRRCAVPWRSVTVSSDGTMRLCEMATLGTAGRTGLGEAFNCADARLARRSLKDGLGKTCASCQRRWSE